MLKNDTLKNGLSRIGLYGSAPRAIFREFCHTVCAVDVNNFLNFSLSLFQYLCETTTV